MAMCALDEEKGMGLKMKKNFDNKKMVFKAFCDPYKLVIESENEKKIFIDEKQIALSVGSYLGYDNDFKSTLSINVYYDSNNEETLTKNIPQLEGFGNIIAINPEFKEKKVIEKLKELNIISQTLDTVKYKNKNYELVKVNIDELELYKPFGDAILKDYKSIEKHRENSKGNEI